jgi:hypothetical protein
MNTMWKDFIINQIGKTNTYGKTQSIKESIGSESYLEFLIYTDV